MGVGSRLYLSETWNMFILYYNSSQNFNFTFDFDVGQLNICVPKITARTVIGAVPKVCGVVNLYDIPNCCAQSENGIVTTILLPSIPAHAQHLKDFTTLFEADPQDLSDAVLKCQGVEMPVHLCIVAARYPVLTAMFRNDMKEACTKTAIIDDVDPDILRKVLKCIYTGRDDFPDEMEVDVLYAAEKYALIELKDVCIDKIKATLKEDNAFDILIVGELYDEGLKAQSKAFICEQRDFSKLEKWNSGNCQFGIILNWL